MSNVVDERIVSMKFDNKQFESGVATTMSTLEKFKSKLNLTGAAKGLDGVGSAAKRIDMSGLVSGVETVHAKFSALQVMGVTALANITNSAVNAGKRIASALTIDPIKTGLSEYETQIGAVQTILSNTKSKGSTLDDVNNALDELNTYADKTIYNFTEMTRNIGTFTAAGVELDTSVSSIKGIANLAAVSGSTSQQASTAMYQLSQALAAGKVSLMDWNSVVNAGMGGQLFQDALKRTAKAMGKDVDGMIAKYGSFRESLTQGEWLTADVLTETLTQLSGAYTEADLLAKGYTKEQAADILALADDAVKAATKVKTATQLWDTLKETAQSGWTQTWEILLGDFEEARTLFSDLYETLSPMIESMSKARNDLLQGWADAGGRADVITSLYNVFEGIGNVVRPIKEAFREIFPPTTVEQLVNVTKNLKNLTEVFKNAFKPGEENANNLKRTFKGLFAILDIGRQAFSAIFSAIKPLFGVLGGLGGGLLKTTATWGDWLVNLNETIKTTDFFGKAVSKIQSGIKLVCDKFVIVYQAVRSFLEPAIKGVVSFGESVGEVFSAVIDKSDHALKPFETIGLFIKSIFTVIGDVIRKITPWLATFASTVGTVFTDFMNTIASSVGNADYSKLFDTLNGGIFAAIGVFIAKFIKSGGDILDNAGGFLENINDILEGVSDAIGAFTQSLKAETLKKIATAIAILAASLFVLALIDSEKLAQSLGAVSVLFAELMLVMDMFAKTADGVKIKNMYATSKALTSISTALLILAVAMKIMSTMSWQEMGVGLISITVGLGLLVGAVNLLPDKKVNGAAKAIKKMSTALLILSVALKIMGSMDWKEMGVALISMTVGLGLMVGAVNLLPKDMALRTAGMFGLATAMVALGAAMKIMGSMDWKEMGIALISLGVGLGIIVGAVNLLPKDIALRTAGMLGLATSLVVVASALKIMGSMSIEEMAKALGTLFISMGTIAMFANAMKSAIPGAAAMLIVAAAIAVFTPALMLLSKLSWEEIARGIAAIAGVFLVLGVAGLVLKPLIPTILALAGSIALFGVGIAALGIGVTLIAAGVAALAVALSAGGGAIVIFVSSLIGLIPYAIEQVGVGIIKLCEVIAGSVDAICKAVEVIITALVQALVTSTPVIADGALLLVVGVMDALIKHVPTLVGQLFDFLIAVLDALAQKLPELTKSVVKLFMSFFSGVIDALGQVDLNTLIQGLAGIGILSAMMLALAAIAALTPAAMLGVLGLGAVITEMAIVLAAIGALAQIPGLEWLISEGGDFLQTVGTAIGQFLGGIVGGFAQGATSALPQIGKDLSDFMINATPFLMGVKMIDASMMDGVKALAETILLLTAANVLEGLTSWITGGSSLASFGEQLGGLGANLNEFATNLGTFGEDQVNTVTCAANAIESIAKAAKSLPNEGGWAAKIFGENGLATFSGYLPKLGTNLSKFADNLGTFGNDKVATVDCAANAIKAIAEAAKDIPNEGGWAAKILGDNSLATFSEYLPDFGTNLGKFAKNLGTFGDDKIPTVSSAVEAIKAFATLADSNLKGAAKHLATFCDKLPGLGADISSFCTKMPSTESVDNTVTNLGKVLSAIDDIENVNSGALSTFASSLKMVSEDAVKKFIAAFTNNTTQARLKVAATTFAEKAVSGAETQKDKMKTAGKDLANGLIKGIEAKMQAVYNAAYKLGQKAVQGEKDGQASNSPSKLTILAGRWLGEGLIVGMKRIGDKVYRSGSELGESTTDSISGAMGNLASILGSDIDSQPTIRPVMDLSDVKAGTGALNNMLNFGSSIGVSANIGAISSMMNRRVQNGDNGEVVSAINKLRNDLGKVGNTSYNINGVSVDGDAAVEDAVRTLVRAITVEGRT